MKAEIVAKIAVWFIIFVALLTLGLGMMSTPNSVENVLGFLLIVVIFYLSIKTKCLTIIKFKKDEKILANDVGYINSYHTLHYLYLDRYKC